MCKECSRSYGKDRYRKKNIRKCPSCGTVIDSWIRRCDSCWEEWQRIKNIRKHGITEHMYEEIYNSQDGACAICHSTEKLVIDHDHTCCPGNYGCAKCIRGLLCFKCNTALGGFSDDINILKEAVKYLQ